MTTGLKREEREAIAAVDCEVCGATAGNPCLAYPRPHQPIKSIHVLRTLAYRAAKAAVGSLVEDQDPR